MLTTLIVSTVLSAFAQCGPTSHNHGSPPPPPPRATSERALNANCPVMGDPVNGDTFRVTVRGQTYGLCCQSCGRELKADPGRYLYEDGTPRNASEARRDNQEPNPSQDHSAHQH